MPRGDALGSDRVSETRERLNASLAAIHAAMVGGDPRTVRAEAERVARLARRLGDRRAECLAQRVIAVTDLRRGHAGRAVARMERLLPVARELGDPKLVMTLLGTLGTSAEMIGDTRRSDEARAEVESIARATGDRATLGGSMADRGSFLGLRGDPAAGAELMAEAIGILRSGGMTEGLRWSLLHMSILEARLGRVSEARDHLREAMPATPEAEELLMLNNVIGAMFWIAIAERRAADAEALWPIMLTALRKHGIYWQRAGFLEEMARRLVSVTGHGTSRDWLDVDPVPAERDDLVAAIQADAGAGTRVSTRRPKAT